MLTSFKSLNLNADEVLEFCRSQQNYEFVFCSGREGETHKAHVPEHVTCEISDNVVASVRELANRDLSRPVIVTCIYGTLSENIVEDLRHDEGLTNLFNLKGGSLRWAQQGNPLKYKQALEREELVKYSRQLSIKRFGLKGQLALKNASVLLVGAGGLGSSILPMLAAIGVGNITIVDHDDIEASNLNRQMIYREQDIGKKKALVASAFVKEQNSLINVSALTVAVEEQNVDDLVCRSDLIIDATDSYLVRYLLNKVCVEAKRPLVYGSVQGFTGQVALFNQSKDAPCYECIFPEAPPQEARLSCTNNGVLGNLPSLIASVQVAEAVRYLINSFVPSNLIQYNFLNGQFDSFALSKRLDCTCNKGQKENALDS